MNYLRPALLDLLASNYVLGTLQGRARLRFETLMALQPRAVEAVHVWEQRLHPLCLGIEPVAPPAHVWEYIQTAIGIVADRPYGKFTSAFLNWWKPVAGLAFGAVLSLSLLMQNPQLLGLEPRLDGLPASYVGLLTNADGKAALLASSRRQGRVLNVKVLSPLAVPAGQVAQLWALPKDGAPFAVGVMPASGKGSVALPDTAEKLFANVERLGVTFEAAAKPPGSAPDALPQAFVLTGHCTKLW